MKLYQIKYGEVYVKSAYKTFDDISFTPDIKRAKHLNEEEKDFVLKYFPHAEVKSFSVHEDTSNIIDSTQKGIVPK